jgi:hypothetical protein
MTTPTQPLAATSRVRIETGWTHLRTHTHMTRARAHTRIQVRARSRMFTHMQTRRPAGATRDVPPGRVGLGHWLRLRPHGVRTTDAACGRRAYAKSAAKTSAILPLMLGPFVSFSLDTCRMKHTASQVYVARHGVPRAASYPARRRTPPRIHNAWDTMLRGIRCCVGYDAARRSRCSLGPSPSTRGSPSRPRPAPADPQCRERTGPHRSFTPTSEPCEYRVSTGGTGLPERRSAPPSAG